MFKNNGNALFLILIAIALFGALSYAVTNSGRGGGNVDKETLKLSISTLVQQAGSIKTAVTRATLLNGLEPFELEFTNSVYKAYYNNQYDNPDCNSSDCRVFDPDGGGAPFPEVPKDIVEDCASNCTASYQVDIDPYWRFFGDHVVKGFGSDQKFEVFAGVRVSKQVCIAINDELGITNASGNPPRIPATKPLQSFKGKEDLEDQFFPSFTFPTPLDNQATGCGIQEHPSHGNERYMFYHILAAR